VFSLEQNGKRVKNTVIPGLGRHDSEQVVMVFPAVLLGAIYSLRIVTTTFGICTSVNMGERGNWSKTSVDLSNRKKNLYVAAISTPNLHQAINRYLYFLIKQWGDQFGQE
jgi:hypothetical protein